MFMLKSYDLLCLGGLSSTICLHDSGSLLSLLPQQVKPMTEEQKIEEREESGWKLVHANVFAPPQQPLAFCVAVGTGQQLLFSVLAVACFAAVGFLSPANRGSLMLAMLCLFCLFSFGGGYRAARLHRAFRGASFEAPGLSMAFCFPGAAFGVFVVANIMLHVLKSSGALHSCL